MWMHYIQSMGMSADSLVCRPCRQDVTRSRSVANPSHRPRWEKGRERERSVCFVLHCSESSIAHATISTSELPQINFKSQPLPTPTPLCKYHYLIVYNSMQKRNCRTCGRCLQVGNDRPCPQPEVVQANLHKHTDFTGDISKNDRVCFTCYKFHLALLHV